MPFIDETNDLSGHTVSKERRVALVIGNGAYVDVPPLANPTKDAQAIATKLSGLGFDVVCGIDLDLRGMGDVQAEFERKLQGRPDVAMLFYAGHGMQVREKNYLIPKDASISEMAHLYTRAHLLDNILHPMVECADISLVFLDACRDSIFSRTVNRSFGDSRSQTGQMRGGLAKIDVAGSFVAFATAPNTVAFDGKGMHSPFTGAMLNHIDTPGLSIADMMIDVRNSVVAETMGRQVPWDQSSLRKRFYFLPEPKGDAAESANPGRAAEEWAGIQNVKSIAMLTRFKERYPESEWSEYAEVRIVELRAQDAARRPEQEGHDNDKTERAKPLKSPRRANKRIEVTPPGLLPIDRPSTGHASRVDEILTPTHDELPTLQFGIAGARVEGRLEVGGEAMSRSATSAFETVDLPTFDPSLAAKATTDEPLPTYDLTPLDGTKKRRRTVLLVIGVIAAIVGLTYVVHDQAMKQIARELQPVEAAIANARKEMIEALGKSTAVPPAVCSALTSAEGSVFVLRSRWYSFVKADLIEMTSRTLEELKRQAKC